MPCVPFLLYQGVSFEGALGGSLFPLLSPQVCPPNFTRVFAPRFPQRVYAVNVALAPFEGVVRTVPRLSFTFVRFSCLEESTSCLLPPFFGGGTPHKRGLEPQNQLSRFWPTLLKTLWGAHTRYPGGKTRGNRLQEPDFAKACGQATPPRGGFYTLTTSGGKQSLLRGRSRLYGGIHLPPTSALPFPACGGANATRPPRIGAGHYGPPRCNCEKRRLRLSHCQEQKRIAAAEERSPRPCARRRPLRLHTAEPRTPCASSSPPTEGFSPPKNAG